MNPDRLAQMLSFEMSEQETMHPYEWNFNSEKEKYYEANRERFMTINQEAALSSNYMTGIYKKSLSTQKDECPKRIRWESYWILAKDCWEIDYAYWSIHYPDIIGPKEELFKKYNRVAFTKLKLTADDQKYWFVPTIKRARVIQFQSGNRVYYERNPIPIRKV